MSRVSVRGFAVASATAVTAVGSVVGVASGSVAAQQNTDAQTTADDAMLLADIPVGQQAEVQTASLTQQAAYQAMAADESAKKGAEEAARKAAAEVAIAKKEAAEEAAKAKAEAEAKAKAAKGDFPVLSSYSISDIQSMARQMVAGGQWQCFSNIVDHESSWNYRAVNASSGAYGLFQALPGSKMSSVGSDWQTNPATQIKWGLNYMNERYGSPCDAWSFWQANNWY
ncbi:lytic transglycosylase domain-containing protein [Streptomyces sp. V2]|uniref:Transglycosylase SLT domain-containing protein n=1 Tax=Streptomyces niveiscabiei TaxID=164115 RepID=A0ABW9HNZ9_9ACTN|nr:MULTISPECIES: transglycosylase SLT domain-containing protein [Streptomyces]PWG14695.1 lytic transglycosylase domain-containing protein [Streptomyces sp. V2]QZZ29928.1 transglycosylase SLT domain-containing protein [Streptomyces sp. ST1015]